MTLAALNRDRLSIYLIKISIVFKWWTVCFDWFTKNLRHSKACLAYFVKIFFRNKSFKQQLFCSAILCFGLSDAMWLSDGVHPPCLWCVRLCGVTQPCLLIYSCPCARVCSAWVIIKQKYFSINEINKRTFYFLSWRWVKWCSQMHGSLRGLDIQYENSLLKSIRLYFLMSNPKERMSLCYISAVLEMNLVLAHTKSALFLLSQRHIHCYLRQGVTVYLRLI